MEKKIDEYDVMQEEAKRIKEYEDGLLQNMTEEERKKFLKEKIMRSNEMIHENKLKNVIRKGR